MHDNVPRSSRSATPTPAICIEPDALDINLTAAILSFDDNEVVTSDTAVAKASNIGTDAAAQLVINYSDEDSNDGLEYDIAGSCSVSAATDDTTTAAASSEAATGNDNDDVSVHYIQRPFEEYTHTHTH